jgi:hypothetical protein
MVKTEIETNNREVVKTQIDGSTVKVNRFHYSVKVDSNGVDFNGAQILLVPKTAGDIAESGLDHNEYRYSHGGITFRKACDKADELLELVQRSD